MKLFPVLNSHKIKGCPSHVPWDSLDPEHAKKIHSQTLDRLCERGGLSAIEIVINVEHLSWHDGYKVDKAYALSVVKRLADRIPQPNQEVSE